MRTRKKYLIILLSCLLAFLVTSGGCSRVDNDKDATMQEMAQRFEDMEKRLSALEDIDAIKRLQIEYAYCLHKGNYDTIEDLFTEDAMFGDVKGKEAIRKNFQENLIEGHYGQDGIIRVQPKIELDGDKAKSEFALYFFYYHPKTYQLMCFMQNFMKGEYHKVDGKWLTSSLEVVHNVVPPGGPPTEEWRLNFLEQAQETMRKMHN